MPLKHKKLTVHTSEQVTSTDDNEDIQSSSRYSQVGYKFFNLAEPNHAFDEEIPLSPTNEISQDKKFNIYSRLLQNNNPYSEAKQLEYSGEKNHSRLLDDEEEEKDIN